MPNRNKPPREARGDAEKRPHRKPREPRPAPREASAHRGERIAKLMARAGLCSRREAETWIAAGRVAVNGRVLTSPALNVTADDKIAVDGKPLEAPERTRLFLFNKPAGLVTTERDPEGRPTVFGFVVERFPDLPRLISVGRLDINTEGLLLLTNDGGSRARAGTAGDRLDQALPRSRPWRGRRGGTRTAAARRDSGRDYLCARPRSRSTACRARMSG